MDTGGPGESSAEKTRMNPRRLLAKIAGGSLNNVAFSDVQRLALALGFRETRTESSHHIYLYPNVPELLNLQDVRGEAKPYQLRQLLRLIERYNLTLEREP